MERTRMLTILVSALVLMCCQVKVSDAGLLGTAWTYQGRLMDTNSPADGEYDLQFRLFDDPCAGSLIAGPVNEPNLDVIDGYFTVELDFGSDVFDGNAVWLETGVRVGELEDPNVYTVLMPRTEITPTPYALQTRGIFVDNIGNVGIGTASPLRYGAAEITLDVHGGIRSAYGIGTARNDDYAGFGWTGDDGVNEWGLGVWGDSTKTQIIHNNTGMVTIQSDGKVGIGTNNPAKTLDVMAGTSSAFRVGGTEEHNLEITYFHGGLADVPGSTAGMQMIGPANAHVVLDIPGNDGGDGFYVRVPSTLELWPTVDTTAFVVKASGNIGIGTNNPNEKLEVRGGPIKATGGLIIETRTSDPPSPATGQIWLRTDMP
jgi:hypothetical protein